MGSAANRPPDFKLVLNDSLPDSYELSQVLLAKAGGDGTLQFLTSGWERVLGYPREELSRKTLLQLMWSDRRYAASAVAAILNDLDMAPVDVRIRCRNGLAKGFRLHRHCDRHERMIYIVAEETAAKTTASVPYGMERRAAHR
jgi:PAS domain-containing protein